MRDSFFIPSRDLPLVKTEPDSTTISNALSRISHALGQQDQVTSFSPQMQPQDALSKEHYEEEEDQNFELRTTLDWLTRLVASPLDWINDDSDDVPNHNVTRKLASHPPSKEEIVDKAAELLALLSGKSASGPSTQVYFFPSTPKSTNRLDSTCIDQHPIDVLVNIRDTTLVSDALGGRTWGAAPLLTVELLRMLRQQLGTDRLRSASEDLNSEPTSSSQSEFYSVLELGAGTGLVGLALAKFLNNHGKAVADGSGGESEVVLTDYHPNVMDNLNFNAWLNGWGSGVNPEHGEKPEGENADIADLVRFVQTEQFREKDQVEVQIKKLDWQEVHHSMRSEMANFQQQKSESESDRYVSSAQTLPFREVKDFGTEDLKENEKFESLEESRMFDLLIAADCIYDPHHPEWIKSVAMRHLSKPHTRIAPDMQFSDVKGTRDVPSENCTAVVKNQLHILSPLRQTHQVEIEAVYKAFPVFAPTPIHACERETTQVQAQIQAIVNQQDQVRSELELMITYTQDLEGFDDFGSPRLDLHRKSWGLNEIPAQDPAQVWSSLEEHLERQKALARRKETLKKRCSEVRRYRWFIIEWR